MKKDKFLRFVNHAEEPILVVVFALQLALVFINVVARILLPSVPLSFTEELTLILLLWIVMLGASICFRDHSHLGLSLIYDTLPPKGKLVFSLISTIVSLSVAAVLVICGWEFAYNHLIRNFKTAALGINLFVGSASIPFCGLLFVVRIIQGFLHDIKTIKTAEGGK